MRPGRLEVPLNLGPGEEDISQKTRQAMRDKFKDGKVLKLMVHDLKELLGIDEEDMPVDILNLWDDKLGLQKMGVQYRDLTEDEH